jgi:Ca2+-binding EF-hand superfamily protein
MLKSVLLPLATALSFAAAADPSASSNPPADAADSQARTSESAFSALDRNSDHRVSRTEAGVDRHLSEDFAYIDTDGDGYISATEYAARTRS